MPPGLRYSRRLSQSWLTVAEASRMRLLVTGANGQIGWELARSLMPLGHVTAMDRDACDLARPETLPQIIRDARPDVLVNAAGYTAVDQRSEGRRVGAGCRSR